MPKSSAACRPVQAAVCAAGALANLAGAGEDDGTANSSADATCTEASSSPSSSGTAAHAALISALAGALAGGAIFHSLGQGAWPQPLSTHPEEH